MVDFFGQLPLPIGGHCPTCTSLLEGLGRLLISGRWRPDDVCGGVGRAGEIPDEISGQDADIFDPVWDEDGPPVPVDQGAEVPQTAWAAAHSQSGSAMRERSDSVWWLTANKAPPLRW
jgi:hypothetical protein